MEWCAVRQWFRLDCSYMTDGRLVEAGWEAGLLWPVVLARFKERDGLCQDEDLAPRLLARLTGAPVDVVRAGVDALRGAGFFTEGSIRRPGGAAGFTDKHGLVVPSWHSHNPKSGPVTVGGRRGAVAEPNANNADVGATTVAEPNDPERDTVRDDTVRDDTDAKNASEASASALIGTDIREALGLPHVVAPGAQLRWSQMLQADPDELQGILDWALAQDRPSRAFSNCFDADGNIKTKRPKVKPEKPKRKPMPEGFEEHRADYDWLVANGVI